MGLWVIVKIVGVRRWCSTGLGSLRMVLMRGRELFVWRMPALWLMRQRRESLAQAWAKRCVMQDAGLVRADLCLQQGWRFTRAGCIQRLQGRSHVVVLGISRGRHACTAHAAARRRGACGSGLIGKFAERPQVCFGRASKTWKRRRRDSKRMLVERWHEQGVCPVCFVGDAKGWKMMTSWWRGAWGTWRCFCGFGLFWRWIWVVGMQAGTRS